jgi:predicted MFS family arabinose efflux permease
VPHRQLALTPRQWAVTLLIAAVQFVNILDFVIVMPMGPALARALGISEALLGYVNGSYTAAAAVTGLLGSFFLDRFDRRKALFVSLVGLVAGTAAGGLATDLRSLLLARMVAGAFGGPATSLSFSIIADAIPAQVRGRAMGTVMGAFSVAAVFGVPLGLVLAERLGWRAPFFAVASLGLVVGVSSIAALPPMRAHLERAQRPVSLASLVEDPLVRLSYTMTAVVMMAGFLVIPNIAPFLQLNLGFPQEHLKWAYGCGGVASFFATQLGGRLVDRFGSFRIGTFGALLVISVVFTEFYLTWTSAPSWVVVGSFVCFMLANGLRNVSYNTLASKVPAPEVRARFQSLQSAVQHASSAFAAWLSGQLLSTVPHTFDDPGRTPRLLLGMDRVATVSMSLSLIIPVLLFVVERRVRARLRPAVEPARLSRAPAG